MAYPASDFSEADMKTLRINNLYTGLNEKQVAALDLWEATTVAIKGKPVLSLMYPGEDATLRTTCYLSQLPEYWATKSDEIIIFYKKPAGTTPDGKQLFSVSPSRFILSKPI